MPDVDIAALNALYGEYMAESFRVSVSAGIDGWRDDDLAFVHHWGVLLDSGVPVSIWQGDKDRMVPHSHGEWLAAHIPGSRLYRRPGEGHMSLFVNDFDDVVADLVNGSYGRPFPVLGRLSAVVVGDGVGLLHRPARPAPRDCGYPSRSSSISGSDVGGRARPPGSRGCLAGGARGRCRTTSRRRKATRGGGSQSHSSPDSGFTVQTGKGFLADNELAGGATVNIHSSTSRGLHVGGYVLHPLVSARRRGWRVDDHDIVAYVLRPVADPEPAAQPHLVTVLASAAQPAAAGFD